MAGDPCSYTLDISEPLFRLTTESLRLHSNQNLRYETLANLVNERAEAAGLLDEQCPQTIRDHLSAVPTEGRIRITFDITASCADSLVRMRERFCASLGTEISVGDALSILLFDYVVSQKATAVLERLRLNDPGESTKVVGTSDMSDGKIIPIR